MSTAPGRDPAPRGPSRVRLLHAPDRRVAVTVVGLAAAVLALGGVVWRSARPNDLDQAVATATLAAPDSTLHRVAADLTLAGSTGAAAIAAVVVGVWAWRRWHHLAAAAVCPLTVAVAAVAAQVLKHLVARPRPPTAVLAHEGGFSYPSGHTTAAAALAAIACLLITAAVPNRRRLVYAAGGMYAAAIGATRLVLGVHYLTDVAGAAALGAAAAGAMAWAGSLWPPVATLVGRRRARRR